MTLEGAGHSEHKKIEVWGATPLTPDTDKCPKDSTSLSLQSEHHI